MPLAEARTRALDARAQIQRGIDVAGLKQTEKLELLIVSTFRELALAWHERMVASRVKHPRLVLRVLEKHVFPDLGSVDASKVKPRHVDAVLSKIVKAGAPTVANDALRYLKAIYGFGRRRQIVPSHPASDFRLEDAGGKERSRTRALSIEEIAQLVRAMAFTRTLGHDNELALKLLLLLGARKQELMCACWKELNPDGALWTLPAERTKTGAEIKSPLPALGVKWMTAHGPVTVGQQSLATARRRTWALPLYQWQLATHCGRRPICLNAHWAKAFVNLEYTGSAGRSLRACCVCRKLNSFRQSELLLAQIA